MNRTSVISLLAFMLALTSQEIFAQSESFVPNGKPLVLIFSNVNYSINKEGNNKAFVINRAYLGYDYFFSKNISSRIIIDVADPGVGELHMTAFLKNAFVQFKNDNISARIGMISTDQFSLQERHWGYRYVYMSFQDAYKFGPSADLGAAFEYSPAKFISFDFSVLNGEGFKNVQVDSIFKATFGVTLKPLDGLEIRGYYDRMKNDYAQTTISLFAGYSIKKFRAGFEYNIQKNNRMIDGNDFSGISLYASLGVAEKFSIFTRYDFLKSDIPVNETDPWNNNNDGQIFIAGFDYSPVKGVKISPTYTGYAPEDRSLYFTSQFGLYFEVRF